MARLRSLHPRGEQCGWNDEPKRPSLFELGTEVDRTGNHIARPSGSPRHFLRRFLAFLGEALREAAVF